MLNIAFFLDGPAIPLVRVGDINNNREEELENSWAECSIDKGPLYRT